MSDRDDIDVMDKASSAKSKSEASSAQDNTNSNNKFNQAIRQNPLTHLGEKSEKPGFFEKLKRVFSTEETLSEDIDDSEEASADGLVDDDGFLGNLLGRFRREKDTPENTDDDLVKSDELTVKDGVGKNVSATEESSEEKPEEIFDPEEEEEFKMISAFLEGEEYIPPESKPEESKIKTETENKSEEPEAKTETENKSEEPEAKTEDENKSEESETKTETENKSEESKIKTETERNPKNRK